MRPSEWHKAIESALERDQRAWVLELIAMAAEDSLRDGRSTEANEFYREGIAHAGSFLAEHEVTDEIREWALKLFAKAADNLAAQGDARAASELYQEALSLAPVFLDLDEPREEIPEWILELFGNAARNAARQGHREQAAQLYGDGLSQARAFLAAGTVSPGVRGGMLQLLAEGGQNEVVRGHRERAARLLQEGLAWASAFLALGTASDEIRELVLRTYVYAAENQSTRQDAQGASDLYDAGLTQAREFLAAGEKNTDIREWALWLFSNSGDHCAKQGDGATAVKFYREGFARAQAFLAAGDPGAGVLGCLLGLANAAETCEADGRITRLRDTLATTAAAWLADKSRLPASPTSDAIKKRILSRLEQPGRDLPTIEAFRAFLETCLLDWHRREFPHGLFGTAVLADHRELSPTETAVAALQGLLLWECMQANERIQVLYRETRRLVAEITRACKPWNMRRLMRQPPPRRRLRRLRLSEPRCSQHGDRPRANSSRLVKPVLRTRTPRTLSISATPAFLGRYRRLVTGPAPFGLVGWVVDRYCEELELDCGPPTREKALLSAVVDIAAANEGRFPQPADWLVGCPPWRDAGHREEFLALLGAARAGRGSVQTDASGLGNQFRGYATGTTPADLVTLLDDTWARVRRDAERLDRLTSALKECSGLDALAPPVQPTIQPGMGNKALDPKEALLLELMTWQEIDDGLRQEADLLLGVTFVDAFRRDPDGQGQDKTDLIKRWQQAPPWRTLDGNSRLEQLSRAWSEALESPRRHAVALLKPPGHQDRPIRGWLERLGVVAEFNLDPALLASEGAVLHQAIRRFQNSEPDELVSLLDGAWRRAQLRGESLVRLKAVLPLGWINVPLMVALDPAGPDYRRLTREQGDILRGALHGIMHSSRRSAVVAVLRGNTRASLSSAVDAHLAARARQPGFTATVAAQLHGEQRQHLTEHVRTALEDAAAINPTAPLSNLVGAAERAFAKAVHIHPGRAHESEVTDRLHQWTLAALRKSSERQDTEGVWRALESGRIALSGLSLLPPDAAWVCKTAEALRTSLRHSVSGDPADPAWRNGWPPLAGWIRQCEELRGGSLSSWRECQARLRHDEALVQPYFDPISGALQALWLADEDGLECRRFADRSDDLASHEAQWREHVLEPWALWLNAVLRDPSARGWRNPETSSEQELPASHPDDWDAILRRAPVRRFAETLAAWANAAGVARLIVLLPAPSRSCPGVAARLAANSGNAGARRFARPLAVRDTPRHRADALDPLRCPEPALRPAGSPPCGPGPPFQPHPHQRRCARGAEGPPQRPSHRARALPALRSPAQRAPRGLRPVPALVGPGGHRGGGAAGGALGVRVEPERPGHRGPAGAGRGGPRLCRRRRRGSARDALALR